MVAGISEEERRDQLVRPFGLAAAPDGALLVADPDARRVLRVAPDGAVAELSCGKREWITPMALAADGPGAVLVADAGARAMIRWSKGGCVLLGDGLLERPTGVALAGDRIFVADPPRHSVLVLSRDGAVTARLGKQGDAEGQLHFPVAVAVAPDGSLGVIDSLNFRVARFSGDGRWIGAFGESGDGPGRLARPKAIAFDETGRAWTSDAQRDAVLVFSPSGAFEFELGAAGSSPGHFTHPAGLVVTHGRIWVADSYNRRLQAFEILRGTP